ncbi:hypothetical protein NDU88_006880 [Pleurodeles waltl]|uniref:Uncharacterized protein n=1 Tax=Pleurodeles waltl TaxID=8319 RepID=A0AAV7NRN8_PLEWA|nr:hypothetical protein NDU88_006880 [Pleurodeles waltl]
MRGCWEGGAGGEVAAVPVVAVGTEVPATAKELPSEEESLSLVSAPVPVVELPSHSVPLVPSDSVNSPSRVMFVAAPSCFGANAPPPDDANAHKDRVTKQNGGGRQKKHMVNACNTPTVCGLNTQGAVLCTSSYTNSAGEKHMPMGDPA